MVFLGHYGWWTPGQRRRVWLQCTSGRRLRKPLLLQLYGVGLRFVTARVWILCCWGSEIVGPVNAISLGIGCLGCRGGGPEFGAAAKVCERLILRS